VRNFEPGFVLLDVPKEQNVEIEGSGPVTKGMSAVATELALDLHQAVKQLVRRKIGVQLNDGVDESWLIGKSDRLRAVERRALLDVAQPFKHPRRGCQRGFGWSDGAGQVATHSDVRSRHPSSD
jgi:hypothetical protein